ncbi:MAG: winged helix-turn-helix transcriptional regulator [Candidatus Lokiarchaeota archaeon]|nr:winged helix-turn-helix transcriptional regulator [Candidatus Lokiarchaeota archaeon]
MNGKSGIRRKASIAFLSVLVGLSLFMLAGSQNVAGYSTVVDLSPGVPQDITYMSVTIHAQANVSTHLSVSINNNLRNQEVFLNISGSGPLNVSLAMEREFPDRRLSEGQDVSVLNSQSRYKFSFGAAFRIQSNDSQATMRLGAALGPLAPQKDVLSWVSKDVAAASDAPWALAPTEISGDELYTTVGSDSYLAIVEEYTPFNYVWIVVIVVVIAVVAVAGLVISRVDYFRNAAMKVRGEGVRIHRMSFEKAIQHPVREKILDLVLSKPGIHLNELMRQVNLDSGALSWHLQILVDYQLVKMEKVGQYNAYFPRIPIKNDLPLYLDAVKLMKNETGLRILHLIQEEGPKFQAELASILGVEKKTIRYHAQRLIDGGIIEIKDAEGRKYHVLTPKGEGVLKTIDELGKQAID